jgi:hypothetical protein
MKIFYLILGIILIVLLLQFNPRLVAGLFVGVSGLFTIYFMYRIFAGSPDPDPGEKTELLQQKEEEDDAS